MADPGFPGQHTTTTTVTSNTTVRTDTRFDPSYIKTLPGIIKVAQIVLNFLGFICVQTSNFSYMSRGKFFTFVSLTGFCVTTVLLLLYLFHIMEKFYKIPWLRIEFIFCGIWTLFYLIASCLAASYRIDASFAAAAFFGFCVMVVYGVDTFVKWRAAKAGQLAQGEVVVNKHTTTTDTSPAY